LIRPSVSTEEDQLGDNFEEPPPLTVSNDPIISDLNSFLNSAYDIGEFDTGSDSDEFDSPYDSASSEEFHTPSPEAERIINGLNYHGNPVIGVLAPRQLRYPTLTPISRTRAQR